MSSDEHHRTVRRTQRRAGSGEAAWVAAAAAHLDEAGLPLVFDATEMLSWFAVAGVEPTVDELRRLLGNVGRDGGPVLLGGLAEYALLTSEAATALPAATTEPVGGGMNSC